MCFHIFHDDFPHLCYDIYDLRPHHDRYDRRRHVIRETIEACGVDTVVGLLCLWPGSATAEPIKEVAGWQELTRALEAPLQSETIRLTADIKGEAYADRLYSVEGEARGSILAVQGKGTIDLNGHTLEMNLRGDKEKFESILMINEGADVVIQNGTLLLRNNEYNVGLGDLLDTATINQGTLHVERLNVLTDGFLSSLLTDTHSTTTTDHVVITPKDGRIGLVLNGAGRFAHTEVNGCRQEAVIVGQAASVQFESGRITGAPAVFAEVPAALQTGFFPYERVTVNGQPWRPEAVSAISGVVEVADASGQVPNPVLFLFPAAQLQADVPETGMVAAGTEVTVSIQAPPGQMLEQLTANCMDVTDMVSNDTFTFTMPNHAVVLEAAFGSSNPNFLGLTGTDIPTPGPFMTGVFTLGENTVHIETAGVPRVVDMDVAPYISNGRMMLPLRFVGESLNMDVAFNDHTRAVTLQDATRHMTIQIDTGSVATDHAAIPHTLERTPEVMRGRVMLPMGEIADLFGFSRTDPNDPAGYLAWDGDFRTVTVRRPVA